ncbi:hydroxyacid dehydrogenase [Rariglobus hedericola]|uniref:Hydroxyacid dehydrogenase n=1 Tax=Rariglobus hedericola TaxID=2597822 RepID=A0A556QRQ9_9BACT|nr:hydroxyacid dehydrogenase [Rariglobus hedericola]TSJ79312.1 hydroxyacid dehydrogenase [Rariglobus hedericola]
MTPLTQSEPLVATPSAAPEGRILFALASDERNLFFPGELPDGAIWQDARGLGQASWNRLLATHRPRVLVTGWTTPLLDSALTTLAGQNGPVDYVCHASGSIRHVVTREQIAAGLKVTNWGTLVAPVVAEHALLLIMASLRQLPAWRDHMLLPPTAWRAQLLTRTLHGARVSIHGFGAIARELIRLLQPFNVTVTVYSAGVPEALIREHGATPAASLHELARHADIFVTCEALTDLSRKSINASVLAELAEGAVFVNVGRGAVADETDLIEAAQTRGLRIGSDVFQNEPLPPDSPFFSLPSAVLSPHIAGPTLDYFAACGRHSLQNIARYLAGEKPVGLITPEIFDRST